MWGALYVIEWFWNQGTSSGMRILYLFMLARLTDCERCTSKGEWTDTPGTLLLMKRRGLMAHKSQSRATGGGALVHSIKWLFISMKNNFPPSPYLQTPVQSLNLIFLHSHGALPLHRWHSHWALWVEILLPLKIHSDLLQMPQIPLAGIS